MAKNSAQKNTSKSHHGLGNEIIYIYMTGTIEWGGEYEHRMGLMAHEWRDNHTLDKIIQHSTARRLIFWKPNAINRYLHNQRFH